MSYSGSPNAYFRQLPELDYPSLANDRSSAYDYQIVKNLFKRAVLREDIMNDVTYFTKYQVKGDERADTIASNFYNDAGLDWVILTTNNIVHVRDEWPMGANDFLTYINQKYTAAELSNVHHYETLLILDAFGNMIQPEGLFVDSNHSVTFLDNGVSTTLSRIKEVTFLQHETDLNDKKRQINILKSSYVELFLRDVEDMMSYEKSQGYIDDRLKKTENPRIISP